MIKLSAISYRACIVAGLMACLMACLMATTAGAATPQGTTVVSSQITQYLAPQQFNVHIESDRGALLMTSSVSVTDVGASRLGSWKTITYTRSCTMSNGMTSVAPGTFHVGTRFSIQRDPQRANAFVITVQRSTLTSMHTEHVNGCRIELPTLVDRTASFVVTQHGGKGSARGVGGFHAVVTRT